MLSTVNQRAMEPSVAEQATSRSILFEREAMPQVEALRRFALRLCQNSQLSQDLVQETMLKAWQNFHSYRAGTNCRAWLFQICKNSYINAYRRRHYEPISVDFHTEVARPDQEGEGTRASSVQPLLKVDAEAEMDRYSLSDELLTALRSLPLPFQAAVVLRDLEGLPYEEIADVVSVPIGTVRSRISRGRGMLAQKLSRPVRSGREKVAA